MNVSVRSAARTTLTATTRQVAVLFEYAVDMFKTTCFMWCVEDTAVDNRFLLPPDVGVAALRSWPPIGPPAWCLELRKMWRRMRTCSLVHRLCCICHRTHSYTSRTAHWPQHWRQGIHQTWNDPVISCVLSSYSPHDSLSHEMHVSCSFFDFLCYVSFDRHLTSLVVLQLIRILWLM